MRLCGKCGKLGYPTYSGLCPNCRKYHGQWYDGFKSLDELRAYRAANEAAHPEVREMRESCEEFFRQRQAEIRRSDLQLGRELRVADPEAFADLAGGVPDRDT